MESVTQVAPNEEIVAKCTVLAFSIGMNANIPAIGNVAANIVGIVKSKKFQYTHNMYE